MQSDDWIRHLTPEQVEDLESALRAAKGTGKPMTELTRDDFPLPVLAPAIAEWMQALAAESGVTVPEPIALPDGEPFVVIGDRRAVLLRFIEGESLLTIPRVEAARLIGHAIGRLHAHATAWAPPPDFACPTHELELPPADLLELSDADDLLKPGYLEMESGYLRLPDGQLHVAAWTTMPGSDPKGKIFHLVSASSETLAASTRLVTGSRTGGRFTSSTVSTKELETEIFGSRSSVTEKPMV